MSLLLLLNSVEILDRDANSPVDIVGSPARDAQVPLEAGGRNPFDIDLRNPGTIHNINLSLATVEREAQIPEAFGGSVDRSALVPVDVGEGVQRDPQLPLELQAAPAVAIDRDARLGLDFIGSEQREPRLPVENAGAVARDPLVPVDFGEAVVTARDAQVPAELGGLEQLFRDSNLPVEWLATPSPFVPGNWIAVVGAVAWRGSWREIPTPTGYEYRPAERGREPTRQRRRRRRPAPVAESEVLVSAVSEEALRRSQAMIRLYRRRLVQIEAREAQERADEQALLALL